LKKTLLKEFFKVFIIWFIPLCALFSYGFFLEYNKVFERLKTKEINNVILVQHIIKDVLTERISDLLTLADLVKLHIKDENVIGHVNEELIAFSGNIGVYDQIRLLDMSGQETNRINLENQVIVQVPANKLQNKSHRYYFKETVALDMGEIFISPLDLNIENGKIEQPIKPMIRIGTPVYSQTGKKVGILLLNYLAQNLLDKISHLTDYQTQPISLLNGQGYWLKNANSDMTWGFMYNNEQRFQNYYPRVWSELLEQEKGQILTRFGIFSFASTYPIHESLPVHLHVKPDTHFERHGLTIKNYVWKIVSLIPDETLNSMQRDILVRFSYTAIPLLLLLIFVGWRLTLYRLKHITAKQALIKSYQLLEQRVDERTQELQHEVEIRTKAEERMRHMASYDALTGIPNRALFDDRLLTVMAMNKRHKSSSALLFIDLDDFKNVNDAYGHETGDMVLKQVSKRLKDKVRDSDTVGRYGGDEFVVLLHEINSEDDAIFVAKEIIQTISQEYIEKEVTALIGCSIGIAVYKDEYLTINDYIKKADEAMYTIKKAGKNHYKLA